jgi:hypothetical protein
MNPPEKILAVLEPPPGGLARLRARRDASTSWAPSWWALATGAAAAVAWMAIVSGHSEVRLQLTGGRLIGERSEGPSVQLLQGGRTVPLPSSNANVRIYWVEPALGYHGLDP